MVWRQIRSIQPRKCKTSLFRQSEIIFDDKAIRISKAAKTKPSQMLACPLHVRPWFEFWSLAGSSINSTNITLHPSVVKLNNSLVECFVQFWIEARQSVCMNEAEPLGHRDLQWWGEQMDTERFRRLANVHCAKEKGGRDSRTLSGFHRLNNRTLGTKRIRSWIFDSEENREHWSRFGNLRLRFEMEFLFTYPTSETAAP